MSLRVNRPTMGARVLVLLGAVLISMAGALFLAPGASAHSVLLSASPADGSSLSKAPSAVVLTFNEAIQSTTMEVAVTASSGVTVTREKATAYGAVITQQLPANLPNDDYTVAYRVISVDGHPVAASTTAGLVGASTASMRRSTSRGSMTEPSSCCLKLPRSLSATFQTKATLS